MSPGKGKLHAHLLRSLAPVSGPLGFPARTVQNMHLLPMPGRGKHPPRCLFFLF